MFLENGTGWLFGERTARAKIGEKEFYRGAGKIF